MNLIKFVKDLWELTHLNVDKKVHIPYGVSDIDEQFKKRKERKSEKKETKR